ncbi:uncharacterized protein LOC111060622 [Nilaparvata lugens]|uniref:uncharacterized protein LOC111060622 n=1 Tax=Nilaparvata lugens TaxID=108931 RepID=UPI00193E0690|nr:uncharacterized protein LOC111060622 [Nilaparvata lugens]XP_039295490.1 uncharacterized protein LOC111060622 [Nilaparvata lugens]
MEIIEHVRSFTNFLGGTRNSLGPRLFILLNLVIQVDQLFSMYINWDIFVKRLLAIKEFNSALFAIFVCSSLDDISSLCNMAEKLLKKEKFFQKNGESSNITSGKTMHQKWDITSKSTNNMEDCRQNLNMTSNRLMANFHQRTDQTSKYVTDSCPNLEKPSKYTSSMEEVDQKSDITSKCLENMVNIDRRLKTILVSLILFSSGLPIVFACLITLLRDRSKINIEKMPFIIYMHYPEGYKTLEIYFMSLFLQLVWYATMLSYVYCASVAFALASISLCTQMKLICLSLFEVGSSGSSILKSETVGRTGCDDSIEMSHLKQIIRDHQEVFNDFLELNKRSKIFLSAFINILAIQMCCYIFFIIELENVSAKIKYLATLLLVFSLMFYFSTVGQKLTDESGNVELALWECPWTDRSMEFRKCILMMMTRASRKVLLRPYNLYVVDFKCITNIVNATYSYFNLISNSK